MNYIWKLSDFSQLSQAGYVYKNLVEEGSLLNWLEKSPQTNFSLTQAQNFVDRYELVDQQPNDKTGFSATVFREKETGRLILSCRGTEPEAQPVPNPLLPSSLEGLDILVDVNQVMNPALGCAVDQIVSLYNYVSRLNAPNGAEVTQYKADWIDGLFHGVKQLSETASGLGVFSDADGALKSFDITGHSLGGELAQAAARLFSAQLGECVTFNSAGFVMESGNPDRLFDALVGPRNKSR